MLGGDQFDDKAKRLLMKLSSLSTVNVNKSRIRTESTLLPKTVNLNELLRISEEMESTDEEARKKIKGLRDQIKKLEHNANEENESRNRLHENFLATINKVDKNMKSALAGVKKSFQERQKKLQQKIESILKNERKEIEMKMEENEDLLEEVKQLQIKVQAIIEEVSMMRRTRVELEDRINRQFFQQIKELKRIFEKDLREREEKESQLIGVLKRLYKVHTESIHNEEVEREANQKMLLTVVEQLVNRIMEV